MQPWDQRQLLGLDWRTELARLTSLHTLELGECVILQRLPEQVWQLTTLRTLVCGCDMGWFIREPAHPAKPSMALGACADPSQRSNRLCELSESLGALARLTRLDLSFCGALKQVPAALCSLTKLENLLLSHCEALAQLSASLGSLVALTNLDINHCESLTKLPESTSKLGKLVHLDAWCCQGLASLPDGFGKLTALQQLRLRECKALTALPDNFVQLVQLRELDLGRCSSLVALPATFGALRGLQQLRIDGSAVAELPATLGKLHALTYLDIRWCKSLARLPDSCAKLEDLIVFKFVDCPAVPEPPPYRLECCQPGTGHHQLRWVLKQQQQRVAVRHLANHQDALVSTLERMSWLVVLLATATFVAYLSPPGGIGDDKQVLVSNVASCSARPVVEGMTGLMQCALVLFFVLDGLSFGLSFGCLMMIVMLSMPRVQWADEQAEAGRFYILLLCAWLLLFLAVATGFAAFIASGLAVHRQAGAVVGPVVPGMVLLVAGALFFWHRFNSLYPGGDAIWAARPFRYRELAPVETDVELGQARFWQEWPVYLSGLRRLANAELRKQGLGLGDSDAAIESAPLLGQQGPAADISDDSPKQQQEQQRQQPAAVAQVLCVASAE